MRSSLAFLIFPTVAFHIGPSTALSRLPVPASHSPAHVLSPSFGFEATTGVNGLFEAGFFYDQNLQISTSPSPTLLAKGGAVSFYGGILRAGLGFISSAFVDFRTGFTRSSFEQLRSNTSLGAGVGVGYRHDITPVFQLSPRVGYRWLPQTYVGGPASQAVSYLDFSLLLSVGF